MSNPKPKPGNRQSPISETQAGRKLAPSGMHKLLSQQSDHKVTADQISGIYERAGCKRMSLLELAAWLTEEIGARTK